MGEKTAQMQPQHRGVHFENDEYEREQRRLANQIKHVDKNPGLSEIPHGTSSQDNCDYLSLQRSLWLYDDDIPGTMPVYEFFGQSVSGLEVPWKTG